MTVRAAIIKDSGMTGKELTDYKRAHNRLAIDKTAAIATALARQANGESLREIAPSMGISHVRLRAILLGEVPEQYREAQVDTYLERIAEADELLENSIVLDPDTGKVDQAASSINIARAREIGRFARWDAERRLPHLFGQRSEVHMVHDISTDLRAISERRRQKAIESSAYAARPAIDVTPNDHGGGG